MTHSQPPFGLLLDVDGPIASPITRKLDIPSIATDLANMANAGIPIAFNTGRSLEFVADVVIPPLREAGLKANARTHSIGEKGGTWASITPTGHGTAHTDPAIGLDPRFVTAMRDLVHDKYADTMFFDETKITMISLEMIPGIAFDDYYPAQAAFNAEALAALAALGLGATLQGIDYPASNGDVTVRIEPTIISTDIELALTGKALGAQRALELFEQDGSIPQTWYTVGDSRSDYGMADWLHQNNYDVTHVDVRPAEGVPTTSYPVRTYEGLVNDASAAALFRELATGQAIIP